MIPFRYPYPKPGGTIAYRPKQKRWPKWYTLERCKDGELVGSLQTRFKKCGKENCRCASGRQEDRHGPYFYRLFYVDGERRREYVRLEDLDEVRDKIERRQGRLAVEREERRRHMRRGEGGGRGGRNAYQKFKDGQLERKREEEARRTGAGARPFDVAWAENIIQQCKAASVACFVKQIGSKPYRSSKRRGARQTHLKTVHGKGGDPREWPPSIRVREYPDGRLVA